LKEVLVLSGVPRHVKGLKDFIGKTSTWTRTELEPSLEDFKEGRVAIRGELIHEILEELEDKNYCIIAGPRDSGKTWLCCSLGYYLEEENALFRYIKVDDNLNGDEIWNYMEGFKGDKKFYWIIEDCHDNFKEIRGLLKNIQRSETENFKIILTIRRAINSSPIFRFLDRKDTHHVQLGRLDEGTIEHGKNIIKKFIQVENVREWIEVEEEEIESTSKKWGTDFYSFTLRLKYGWRFQQGMKLCEIKDEDVYDYIWSPTEKIKLSIPKRRKIILTISALSQFKPLSIYEIYLYGIGEEGVIIQLEKEGIIGRTTWENRDFFRIQESRAEWFLRTIKHKMTLNIQDEGEGIFKDYLISEPPNWVFVFQCLYRSREFKDIVPRILTALLDDREVWNLILNMVKREYFFSFFEPSHWEEIIRNSSTFDSIYRLICNKLEERRLDDITRNLTEVILQMDMDYLIDHKNPSTYRLYAIITKGGEMGLDTTHFLSEIIQLDIESLRKLFSIQKGRRMEVHGEPKGAYLLGLNGITDIARDHSIKIAPLIENLSEFKRKELRDLLLNYTDLKVINYFLSQPATQNPKSTQEIIKRAGDDVWINYLRLNLTKGTKKKEPAFWLLWNIYRYDKEKAKLYAQSTKELFSENIRTNNFTNEWKLPLMGLFQVLEIKTNLNPDDEADTEEAINIIRRLNNQTKPDPTRILLSMISLKNRASKEKFELLKNEIISKKWREKNIEGNPNQQLVQIFQDLISKHLS
jgi:hypothetical protein